MNANCKPVRTRVANRSARRPPSTCWRQQAVIKDGCFPVTGKTAAESLAQAGLALDGQTQSASESKQASVPCRVASGGRDPFEPDADLGNSAQVR